MSWYKKAKTHMFTEPSGRRIYVHYDEKCSYCGKSFGRENVTYDDPFVCPDCGGKFVETSGYPSVNVGHHVGLNYEVGGGNSWDNLVKNYEDNS